MSKGDLISLIQKFIEKNFTSKKILLPSNIEIARQFKEKTKASQKVDFLRCIVSEALKGEQIEIESEENIPYQVIGNSYYWITKDKKTINIPVEKVDDLFYHYSIHGLNWSQTKMINKFDLKTWEWNSLKSRLMLVKQANIFSPHTVESTPKDQLKEMIDEKINKAFSQVGFLVEESYEKNLLKKYKREVEKFSDVDNIIKMITTELQDSLPKLTIQREIVKTKAGLDKKVISLFVADIHYGAESRNTSLPPYSPDITREYLKTIAATVNGLEASEVHIFFVGDLVESVSGLSHIDSWKGLSKGMYGSRVILETYKLLAEFITSIVNVKSVYGVSGNHDRLAADRLSETEGFAAEIIFEFIKLSLKDQAEVFYDEKIISVKVDGINVILTHGDKKFTDLPPSELILEHGTQGMYNLLISGHWHQRKTKADSKNFRHLVCASLFPGNDYSVNLGYSSQPGYLLAYNNGKGKPTIIDECL